MTLILSKRRPLARRDAPARLKELADNEFAGYASLFGVPDGAGDIVERGAFAASLRRRPAPMVRMLYQHSALEPIGLWSTIKEDARGLYVRGRLITDVVRAREVRALLRDGALDGLSIGFRTKRARRDGPYRRLSEIELWEISVVTFPLLAGSLVTAVGGRVAQSLRAAAKRMTLSPPPRGPHGEVETRSVSGGGQVICLARAWIGTPYVHQASLKGVGCDCLGLLRGLWREMYGDEPQTVPPYLPDWDTPGGESLRDGLARHLDPVPLTGIAPGDVLVFRMVARGPARHCGVLAIRDGRFTLIHARQNKRVSEEPFTTFWRGKLAYAFRLTPQPGYDRVSGGV